jgi:predicted transcriptional regulator
MKMIKVGIASQEEIRERMLAIAKGEFKPKPSDPRIWFTSMRSLFQVVSDENRTLLDFFRKSRLQVRFRTGKQTVEISSKWIIGLN